MEKKKKMKQKNKILILFYFMIVQNMVQNEYVKNKINTIVLFVHMIKFFIF